MSARSPFSKFSLKPSSLSQHTVNFNKILEEVAAPKIDSIVLEKPKFGHAIQPTEPKKQETPSVESVKEIDLVVASSTVASSNVAAPAFVFGESLTDRVINTESACESTGKENGLGNKSTTENAEPSKKAESSTIFAEVDHEKYNNNDIHTLIRMNCKLFVLDKDQKDQAVWAERGYGVLKIIDKDDGLNIKIMMWTDKCYRLVLNTKFFETMVIERVNRKSIRLNAQDEGTIKNFLIKCGHPNEGEELAAVMINRLHIYKENLSLSNESSKLVAKSEISEKDAIFECECNWESLATNKTLEDLKKSGKITLHKSPSGQQHMLVDIYDDSKSMKVVSNQLLKSIKLVTKSQVDTEDLISQANQVVKQFEAIEFEIKESFNLTHKVTIQNAELAGKFLKYYIHELKQMPIPSNNTSINDSLNNETSSDEDEEENESESIRNSNTSRSLESSLTETNKSDTEIAEIDNNKKPGEKEVEATGDVQKAKKRKPSEDSDDSDSGDFKNENIKKMSLDESGCSMPMQEVKSKESSEPSLKRNTCNSSQDSSQEGKSSVKKTRVTEDDLP